MNPLYIDKMGTPRCGDSQFEVFEVVCFQEVRLTVAQIHGVIFSSIVPVILRESLAPCVFVEWSDLMRYGSVKFFGTRDATCSSVACIN